MRGLDSFEGEHPRVAPVFFGFRIMVGVGLLMMLVSWTAVWVMRKGRKTPTWLVQGVLRTAEAVGPVGSTSIAASLTTYLLLYAELLTAYVSVVFYLASQAAAGYIPRERARLDNPMQPVGA